MAITELRIVITKSPQISIIFIQKLCIYKNLTNNSFPGRRCNNLTHVVRKHFRFLKSQLDKRFNNHMATMDKEFYVYKHFSIFTSETIIVNCLNANKVNIFEV